MKWSALVLVVCFGVVPLLLGAEGCDSHPLAIEQTELARFPSSLTYIRDDRTKLCFAVLAFDMQGPRRGYSFTSVPCESVESLLTRSFSASE